MQRGQANHRGGLARGGLLQDSSDLGRGVNAGISANAMHHISAAMIAGYQNNIGMTNLLCQKTTTADQSSLRSRRVDQNWHQINDLQSRRRPILVSRGRVKTPNRRPILRRALDRARKSR